MLKKLNLRRTVATIVLAGMALGMSAGLLVAQADQTNQDANAMANYFKIGNRPPAITAEDAQLRISHFPSFGEHTVNALRQAAPIETISKLYSLKNANGKSLLNEKQIMLLLIFYNLKP